MYKSAIGRAKSLYTRNIEFLQNGLILVFKLFLNANSEKPHMTVGKNASHMSYRLKTVSVPWHVTSQEIISVFVTNGAR